MNAWKIYVDGYPTESYAYVLADTADAAKAFMKGEFEDGWGEIVVEREPKLDGDEITDRTLYESGLGWSPCTRCDRYPDGHDGFCDDGPSPTCTDPVYDDYGRIFCSERCRDQIPPLVKPWKQLYAMLGSEY